MSVRENFLRFAAIPAPSGYEQGRIDCIAQTLHDNDGIKLSHSPQGSLIAHRPGKGKRIMLYAPVDEPGFLTTQADANGFSRFLTLGQCEPAALIGREVASTQGRRGVILPSAVKEYSELKSENLLIDAYEEISEGEKFALASFARELGGCLYAASITGSLCAAILVELLAQAGGDCDLFCVFAAQHALGARDAAPAAYLCRPEYTISLSTLEAEDMPGGSEKIALNAGAYVLLTAGCVPVDPQLLEKLCSLGAKPVCGIAPELPIVQAGGAGCRTGGVAIAVRGLRAHAGKAALSDCDTVTQLLCRLLEEW